MLPMLSARNVTLQRRKWVDFAPPGYAGGLNGFSFWPGRRRLRHRAGHWERLLREPIAPAAVTAGAAR
jgi:hypothetical protein